jgi:hypothetical protein
VLLTFNGILCSKLMSTLIHRPNIIHHPYIAKCVYLRILSQCISTILPKYLEEVKGPSAPGSTNKTPPVAFFIS